MKTVIDIEPNLRKYLPSLFLLLEENNIDWKKITLKFQKELFSRKTKLEKEGKSIIHVQTSLFDIITKIACNDFRFLNLYRFINEVFTNLSKKTTAQEKKLLKNTIYNILINVDTKFFNFLGELAYLGCIKNEGFELLQIEQPLNDKDKKSTKIDFTIKKNDKILLVEILNIHLPETSELTQEIIARRLNEKINEKRKNKQKGSQKTFYIVPILWGEYEAIKMVNNYYVQSNPVFENTLSPFAYASYNSIDGKFSKNTFAKIETLISREQEYIVKNNN